MVSREFVINGLRSFYAGEGIAIPSSFAGKLKTTLQIVGISCVLFSPSFYVPGLVIIYASLFFSLYSAYRYIRAIFRPEMPE
jgi:CDP-diacylglycerol--glycerol-3-phosphate 3-phosphatidyltransferase